MKIVISDNKLQGDDWMSLDTSDYEKLCKIEEDLNEIKVELREHNRLMQELINGIKTLAYVCD